MRRLKLYILFFCVALSVPLAYFVFLTYRSLEQEEISELRYFADTLFERMESELALFIQDEEMREVDEYTYLPRNELSQTDTAPAVPHDAPAYKKSFIIGYFQNNPNGTMQTPLAENVKIVPKALAEKIAQLQEANRIFNQKRLGQPEKEGAKLQKVVTAPPQMKMPEDISGRYFDSSKAAYKKKEYLGSKEKKVKRITAKQALNVAQLEEVDAKNEVVSDNLPVTKTEPAKERRFSSRQQSNIWNIGQEAVSENAKDSDERRRSGPGMTDQLVISETLDIEIDPMQSILIDDDRIFIFRRIVLENQIYRQGFVIAIKPFLAYLTETYFSGQPLARFTHLELQVINQNRVIRKLSSGIGVKHAQFELQRLFPRPFSFVRAVLSCDAVPPTAGRKTLNILIFMISLILVIGLFAIYTSTQAVIDLSERRSLFVSSVTHELKTPLTNIRMYIEMLEQGIAPTPEREADYFRILVSESARLSRLINNVLEFSKLEKKQRPVNLQSGTFEEVLAEVRDVMREKLRQESFTLDVTMETKQPFTYDREMMVQILINLMENAMKFGRNAVVRHIHIRVQEEGKWIKIAVSDTGPGIERHSLKRVFDDFFRGDSAVVNATSGTGIGLALVKKCVTAMGGTVSAENNMDAPGCTITVYLPV